MVSYTTLISSGSFSFGESRWEPDFEIIGWHLGGSKELWYHSPLCLSAEKNLARSKVIDKKYLILLKWDACEAYKWAGEGVMQPENLLGYRFINKGKVGRRRTSFS